MMADQVKISELPAAGALTGAELLELVQAGINRQASLAAVRATRAVAFAYGDASPRSLVSVAAGTRVIAVTVFIDTGFDGTGAALEIGEAGDADGLMAADQINPSIPGTYGAMPGVVFTGATDIRLSITPGDGASQGSGSVVFTLL